MFPNKAAELRNVSQQYVDAAMEYVEDDLVMPQMFAYKAVKWLTGMEVIDSPHKGYWEVRGYPADAWIKPVKKG